MELPLREELVGMPAVRRAAARRPGRPERQREPLPAERLAGRRGRGRGRQGDADLNRYPDRERSRCAGRWPATSGTAWSAEQVWAANGSNEVHAAAAAGVRRSRADGAGVRADLLDAPRVSRAGPDRLGRRPPRRRLRPRPRARVAQVIGEHRPTSYSCRSPNNPTGTALPLDDRRGALRGGGAGHGGRRRGVRASSPGAGTPRR